MQIIINSNNKRPCLSNKCFNFTKIGLFSLIILSQMLTWHQNAHNLSYILSSILNICEYILLSFYLHYIIDLWHLDILNSIMVYIWHVIFMSKIKAKVRLIIIPHNSVKELLNSALLMGNASHKNMTTWYFR